MRIASLILVAAIAACSPSQAPASPEPALPTWDAYLTEGESLGAPLAGASLSADGLGPLRIGMPIQEVNALLGSDLETVASEGDCNEWLVVLGTASGLSLLGRDGRVVRISTFGNLGIRTPEDIGIGSMAADVNAAYPGAQRVAAEYYDEPAHDLYAWRDTENWIGLHFRIDETEHVAEMEAGGELKNIEGCAPSP